MQLLGGIGKEKANNLLMVYAKENTKMLYAKVDTLKIIYPLKIKKAVA